MHDWFFKHGGRKGPIDWLRVDAWIDSSLAETWEGAKDPVIGHPHFAGTGTRFLTPSGKTAIAELFRRTFG